MDGWERRKEHAINLLWTSASSSSSLTTHTISFIFSRLIEHELVSFVTENLLYIWLKIIIHRHHHREESGTSTSSMASRSDTIQRRSFSQINTRTLVSWFGCSHVPPAKAKAGARWEIRKIYLWECRGGKIEKMKIVAGCCLMRRKGNVTEEIIRRSMKCFSFILRVRMHNTSEWSE